MLVPGQVRVQGHADRLVPVHATDSHVAETDAGKQVPSVFYWCRLTRPGLCFSGANHLSAVPLDFIINVGADLG